MVRAIFRILAQVAGWIPSLLVWAGLVGLFVYGSHNNWKWRFSEEKARDKGEKKDTAPDNPDDDEPFTPYPLSRPFDVPVMVVHSPFRCPVFSTAQLVEPTAGASVVGACGWLDFTPKSIKLKSAEIADRAGIKTVAAKIERVSVSVEAHGEVQQDPTATAKASPRAGGVLFALEKQLGDRVRKGELLALIESAEVGKAKPAYLTARAMYESRERVRASLSPESSPMRTIVEAQAAAREASANLYSAQQGLANLGLPVPDTNEAISDQALTQRLQLLGVPFGKRLELYARANAGQGLPANLLPLFSPLDGVVTRRNGVVGETVAALQPVYEVGDPSRIYVYLDVRQEDSAKVAIGQDLTFTLEGGAIDSGTHGMIDWISPVVDDKTRTVRVRGRVPNPDGKLRAGAFGGGTVVVDPPRPALVVPKDAIHWEGCCHLVFVKVPPTKREATETKETKEADEEIEFRPRRVTTNVRDGGWVEITSGLKEGEEVAVGGSHVLKNELLKGRIGGADESFQPRASPWGTWRVIVKYCVNRVTGRANG
jgi:cobalt-zinc-cadmium efflux system membrane fusion protein